MYWMEKYFANVLLLFSEIGWCVFRDNPWETGAKENGEDSMKAWLREMGRILEREWSHAFE